MKQQFFSESESNTEQIAYEFAKTLKKGDFIAFFGNLGSGKTAFTRGLAKYFCPYARVSSPTYAIVNEYLGDIPIFHFDMYRIEDEDSLYSIGFYDYLERNGICVCEWSENITYALPDKRYDITFEKTGENSRIIVVEQRQ